MLSPEDGELKLSRTVFVQNSRYGDELFQGCTADTSTWLSTDQGEPEERCKENDTPRRSKAHSPGSRDASTPWQAISLVWSWLSHSPFQMPVYEGHLDLFAQLSILFTSSSSRERLFSVRVKVPLA